MMSMCFNVLRKSLEDKGLN